MSASPTTTARAGGMPGRRSRGPSFVLASLAAVSMFAVAAPGRASEEPVDAVVASETEADRPGWKLGFGFGFGASTMAQRGSARVPTSSGTTELRGSGDSYISEAFTFMLDLHTPLVLEVPTRPTLMLRSSFQLPIATGLISSRIDRALFRTSPGFADSCPATVLNGQGVPVATSTCNLSVRTRTTINAMWSAGIAVDFTLPFDEDQFHFIQGVNYVGMAVQPEGTYKRRSVDRTGSFSAIDYVDSLGDDELFHGVGLVETLLADAYEQGPLTFSVFVEGRVSWFATDRDISAKAQDVRGPFVFNSSFNDPEPFQYQVLGGVLIRFDPALLR